MKVTGYIQPVIKPEDYVFGASPLPQIILQPDGNWTKNIPSFEPQKKQFETANCTGFTTLQCLEILQNRLMGLNDNYSDRCLGIFAGTFPPGNSPTTVAHALHKQGAVAESLLPFSDGLLSPEEYYSFKGGDEELCIQRGKEWVETFDFGYEMVPTDQKSIMSALQMSPLGVAVYAWEKGEDGVFYNPGVPSTHWTTLVDYVEGKHWIVYDSYLYDGEPYKKLSWDFSFSFILRYHLRVKPEIKKKLTLWESLLKDLRRILEIFWPPLAPLIKSSVRVESVEPEEIKIEINKPVKKEIEPKKEELKWGTKAEARHSVRVLCDEAGLKWADKELICRVINAESGFDVKAKNENKNKAGKVLSTDWGIVQINSFYHVGPGKEFASVQEILDKPEKSVLFMIRMFKANKLNLWIAYRSGNYLNYSS